MRSKTLIPILELDMAKFMPNPSKILNQLIFNRLIEIGRNNREDFIR